ncbi:MAG TPA: 4Fe-4S binding protein [Streptosporangiaceae bacterium]
MTRAPARAGAGRTVPARSGRTVPARSGLNCTSLTCAVVTSGCLGCGACLLTCPERAIRPAGPGAAVPLAVRAGRCTGCGECVEVCPADAIYLAQEVVTR